MKIQCAPALDFLLRPFNHSGQVKEPRDPRIFSKTPTPYFLIDKVFLKLNPEWPIGPLAFSGPIPESFGD